MQTVIAKSNFDFLKLDLDTDVFFQRAQIVEMQYVDRQFESELMGIRKIAENIVKVIDDLKYSTLDDRALFHDRLIELRDKKWAPKEVVDVLFMLKKYGNASAHDFVDYTQEEGLKALKGIYIVLVWYMNEFTNEKILYNAFSEPRPEPLYQTSDKKLIYVQTADNTSGDWPAYVGAEKIGDASIDDYEIDMRPNSDDLRDLADKRINQYQKTSGVPHILQWVEYAWSKVKNRPFRDHEVHDVLERSGYKHAEKLTGDEWYQLGDDGVEIAKAAIKAVKEGRSSIEAPAEKADNTITLRPEQQEAVDKTIKNFKKSNRMLWNAKMRFGKTLTALQLVKNEQFQRVLIMTHRPVVSDSWFEDFGKMNMRDAGYLFGSKTEGERLNYLVDQDNPFVYFASIQDLRGSAQVGGKQGVKNELIFGLDWDLVIIDEAHEGTQTGLAHSMLSAVTKKDTNILELSGTPFNLMDQYDEDSIYTWDYVMEQTAKERWYIEHPDEENPYEKLPKVSMYTFEMRSKEQYSDETKSFNFKEFFRVDDEGNFEHEADVNNFLNEITKPNKETNYPFSTEQFRNELRHTLWILPGVKEAKALKKLMDKHPVFGAEYEIVNVVDNGDSEEATTANDSDLNRVREAITDDATSTKTITLTVRKLTTGVNVPEWTAVMFLSNTNSATTYLQAAFRAQTPFSNEKFGMKKNAYIFDFAPDRALTVMAESTNLSTKAGKRVSNEQKKEMTKLLNFLPIIGNEGNGMKEFQVDNLLTQIKRVYAEKAVRSGFDDDSLYSDELLMNLDSADLDTFNNLKELVGTTKAEKAPMKVDVNRQGLDNEEYDTAERAKKKKKKDRTPEEQEKIDKQRSMREQKRTMISVLRGISIRIPMMIYGMDIDIAEEVNIQTFIQNVDQTSWEEFMPEGVDKSKFREIERFYDPEVFVEAGRLIRRKVRELDDLDPIDRAEKLAVIFGTFKNPDKETVLTPWRVVNMHMTQTVGGLSYYDDGFIDTTIDGRPATHWISEKQTGEIYNKETRFLEINSKTGLYPLYAATSMYWKGFEALNAREAGKFTPNDQESLWKTILKDNIFVVAKTPMAATITKRTLAGFKEYDLNIRYVEGIVENVKKGADETAHEIERAFNNMKFDVVIGNPPYQETIAKKESDNGQKRVTNIFQHFQLLANNLASEYTSLIYPGGRWIHRSGKGMEGFGLEQINDPKLEKLIFYPDANEVFQGVAIADGISIVMKNQNKTTRGFEYEWINRDTHKSIHVDNPGEKLIQLNPDDMPIADKIDKFVESHDLDFVGNSPVINQKLFRIESDFAEVNPDKVRLLNSDDDFNPDTEIKLLTNDKAGKAGRATWFAADKNVITTNAHLVLEWQVTVSSANAGGQKRDNQIGIVDNHSAFGRSRLALKTFATQQEAKNFLKYATSYVIRYAFLLTDEALSSLGQEVPDIIDYSDSNNLIDFSEDVDSQLAKLLGITDSEFEYIVERVNSIRGAE